MVFLAAHEWYLNGEGHHTSNSGVWGSSWSNFTKKRKVEKVDFGSFFEARWRWFQLLPTLEWSSAFERPCAWLSFPSLGGFWDPNLTSWRLFAARWCARLRFEEISISVFFNGLLFSLSGIVRIVVFLALYRGTGLSAVGTQRGAPNSSIFLFNFWSKDPESQLRTLPVGTKI